MPRILITTDYLRPGDAVDRYLTDRGHVTKHLPMRGPRDVEQLVASLQGVDGALIANEPLSADVLERAPALKAIVRTGVGYDSVDVEAATRLGISVSNLPGINANAVAEYTLGMLLLAARGLVSSARGVGAGMWPRQDGHELRGAVLGLLGFGAAARAVVPLARAFGMAVLCTTRTPPKPDDTPQEVEFVPLDALLSRSDYVSLHIPLTPETAHLIDGTALGKMRPTAVLVNTARGSIVDESALADAVRAGHLRGAVLDVTEIEPLPADSVLRGVDGIVVLSHMAGQTAEARDAAGREGAAELDRALAGQPASSVNAHLITSPRTKARG